MKNFKRLAKNFRHNCNPPPDWSREWKETTWRQDDPRSAHRDTETIYLRSFPGEPTEDKVFNCLKTTPTNTSVNCGDATANKIQWWMNALEVGRAMVVRLKPGGVITLHRDEGAYAAYYDTRVHLVLQAAPGNHFGCGEELVEMKENELWTFDHHQEHYAINNSNEYRIHLIVDLKTKKGV